MISKQRPAASRSHGGALAPKLSETGKEQQLQAHALGWGALEAAPGSLPVLGG